MCGVSVCAAKSQSQVSFSILSLNPEPADLARPAAPTVPPFIPPALDYRQSLCASGTELWSLQCVAGALLTESLPHLCKELLKSKHYGARVAK